MEISLANFKICKNKFQVLKFLQNTNLPIVVKLMDWLQEKELQYVLSKMLLKYQMKYLMVNLNHQKN